MRRADAMDELQGFGENFSGHFRRLTTRQTRRDDLVMQGDRGDRPGLGTLEQVSRKHRLYDHNPCGVLPQQYCLMAAMTPAAMPLTPPQRKIWLGGAETTNQPFSSASDLVNRIQAA
ncbi:hypothetical protein GCM10007385_31050 [Tateyamaria omphalii]|nr:hypothetical protein GCM10007385_31050 [Tateyamaria omphalii]